jgi:spore coat protein U-like protein
MNNARRLKFIAGLIAAAVVVVAPTESRAGSTCNNPLVVVATDVAFGNYFALSPTAVTSNGTITVSCPQITDELPSLTIALSQGISGSYSPRQMAFGAERLSYNLYTTAAFAMIWGDGTGGSSVLGVGSNPSFTSSHTVYGRIPSGQSIAPGSYADLITVTVTY